MIDHITPYTCVSITEICFATISQPISLVYNFLIIFSFFFLLAHNSKQFFQKNYMIPRKVLNKIQQYTCNCLDPKQKNTLYQPRFIWKLFSTFHNTARCYQTTNSVHRYCFVHFCMRFLLRLILKKHFSQMRFMPIKNIYTYFCIHVCILNIDVYIFIY